MASMRRRGMTPRSASVPTGFTLRAPPAPLHSHTPDQPSGEAVAGSKVDVAGTMVAKQVVKGKSPSTRGRERPRQATDLDATLLGDNFVQGGVELPPADETSVPREMPSQHIMQADARLLAEYWPQGDGPRALFLDYDGTLREFEKRPEMAVPTDEIIDLLKAIDARDDIEPHIISGRDAKFLEDCFKQFTRFTLIAEHGFQIQRPGVEGWKLTDQSSRDNHEDWKAVMRVPILNLVKSVPGSHLEEKASSLVWHYREVVDVADVEAIVNHVVEELSLLKQSQNIQDVKVTHGHKIVEVSYRKVRKGLAMRRLCEEKALFGKPYVGVLVAGDDVTDESMFDLAPKDTLTIKVGNAPTLARFRVENPRELRQCVWNVVLGR